MEEKQNLRYAPATRFDLAPYGTSINIVQEDGSHKTFIQLSKDPSVAKWEPMGCFLEDVFGTLLDNTKFIDACLEAYQNDNVNFNKISDILKK